ncbi:bifunctional diaminohydroxyphosphoribosylaminopyrimidine deaminase/5-amino-6-(5-phosphoribosylamino)uracil reductase RibD [Parasalinivibrio latis]|uniref:bifunctional diaminohydroxyphosphoribosylaminopyrimidine deaminase/5-amino-6-(5-phosphoribosylamino)uracil reductase RibD n=1 Tax=Parasalinivibrio latis TaxID=2952610 RepID=UPI0030DF86CD
MTFSDFDNRMMRRALELAAGGRFTTAPNPNVGCVIAKGEKVIGEGFHFRAGEPHAEVHALRQAGDRAKGATAYVTLEPCSHYGRTPPCAEALINIGVSRVVCAMVDPNPQVAGRGIKMLEGAGIQVDVGLYGAEAEALNPGFIKKMRSGMPYVQLKLAASLDGRTALANGESKWITGPEARSDVQVFRAMSSAILSTSATVLADDPSLNVRWEQLPESVQKDYQKANLRQPVRVVIDSRNRVKPQHLLFSQPGKVILLRTQLGDEAWGEDVEQLIVPAKGAGVDLAAALNLLAEKGLHQIWVEAGATLAGALIEQKLVDEFILYQAPKLMGADSRSLVALSGITAMSDVPELDISDVTLVGRDIRIRAIPV